MIDENIIPKGWKVKTLGEVCEKVETVKRKEKNIEEKFVYLDIGGIDNSLNKILHHKDYSWKDAPSRAQQIVFRNDILFSTVRTYMKNIALVDNIHYNGQIASSGFCVIRGKKNIVNHKFIFYLTLSKHFLQPLNAMQTGSSYPAVRDKDVFSQQIPLPPLAEQENIVSKIEELFSELDKSIENLRTAQQQLKTYRQAVLNKLVTGKDLKPIESVIEKLDQGWSPKCENEPSTDNSEWAVIKTSAIQHGRFLDYENKRLPKDLVPRMQHELQVGDILITRAGPRVRAGVCCLVKRTRPKLINCDKAYRIRVNKKMVSPEYFELILNTPFYLDVIEKLKTGINDSGVNLTQKGFMQIEIPIPGIDEQSAIIETIEERLSVTDKMEETITENLQQAEALRQSILKKAFEGKLVTAKERARVIPIERKALACHIININHSHKYFGLTKFQKTLYICEQFAEVEYETDYEQERAGPYDREFTTSFKQQMSEQDWFQTETKVSLTHFLPGANAGKLSREYVKHFRQKGDKIRFVLGLLQEKTLFEAELIATIYAVWNNTIIKRLGIDIDAIITDVYNWSDEKAKYSKQDIGEMFNWMNEVGLVPNGFGKEVKKAIN